MTAKRFRIAFSFAGEKRDFVANVAAILARRFGEEAILYDKYHEAEFARRDLGIYLPELYHKESDLVVVVVCPDYEKKEWCGLEWTAIHALLKNRSDDEVMLGNFDRAEVAGIYDTAGFLNLDHKTPEQAADLVLERLALNEGKPKDIYTKSAAGRSKHLSSEIPNNLPRLQPFFGRSDELQKIKEALDFESRTWGALIDGPGGMGKTSLAVRAAYDCPPGQFERIIFVSVKNRELDDDGVRSLGNLLVPGFLEMLNEIARELGQADIAKSAEDQRVRLLLAALRDSHALLILDNLESIPKSDRDHLFTFIKRLPQGCKAILTSRRRIGSGSELVQLDILDKDAALATLAELAEHNVLLAKTSEAERLSLCKQTGGNPLLLRWVAGQLGRGSCRTFTDALDFLITCPTDNDPLEFVFGDLADEFTPKEECVLVALTYVTLPAIVEHIATIAGLKEEQTATTLDTLANRSLVVPDQEEEEYALVPMVAVFMRRHRPGVVSETSNRAGQRALALIFENGFEDHERFPVLDAAWPTIAPSLPPLLAGPNRLLQAVCGALFRFLDFTGRWDEWLSLSKQAEIRAIAAGDRYEAGWRAYNSGWIHYLRQEADSVLDCANRAAALWQEMEGGTRERAVAIQLRGHGHGLKKDYSAAITAYRETLNLDSSLSPESADVAIDLNWLAGAERLAGDLVASERDSRESLRMARAVGNAEAVVVAIGNLGPVNTFLDGPLRAILVRFRVALVIRDPAPNSSRVLKRPQNDLALTSRPKR